MAGSASLPPKNQSLLLWVWDPNFNHAGGKAESVLVAHSERCLIHKAAFLTSLLSVLLNQPFNQTAETGPNIHLVTPLKPQLNLRSGVKY